RGSRPDRCRDRRRAGRCGEGRRTEGLPDIDVNRIRIYIVDHGSVVLAAFSDRAHSYAADKLEHNGVKLLLNTGVKTITPGSVTLSDGSEILTRLVVWAGGIQAPELAAKL